MQLFPEGGFLMTGANSTVAFHIVDGKKDPVAISGYIKDNRDSILLHLLQTIMVWENLNSCQPVGGNIKLS